MSQPDNGQGPPPPFDPREHGYGQPPPENLPARTSDWAGQASLDQAPRPVTSNLAWCAFVVSFVIFLLGWIPFVGLTAIVGVVLASADLRSESHPPKAKGVAQWALGLSIVALIAGFGWLIASVVVVSTASCPHVYAFDGERYRLDADPLSGALLPGAERGDWDRLEHLVAVDGVYRVRVVDELQEIDRLDAVSLLAVDHPRGTEVLPTPEGVLVQTAPPVALVSATDARGRDVRAPLLAADDDAFAGSLAEVDPRASAEPRERLRVVLPRPSQEQGDRAFLVLRAHTTPFAEESFVHYAATMGPGTGRLLSEAQSASHYPYRTRIADELGRLGLPLVVTPLGEDGSPGTPTELGPVGPAIQRDFAVPFAVPAGSAPTITLELAFTPGFWAIDHVALARDPRTVSATRLHAESARKANGDDVNELLGAVDQRRVELHTGELVDLRFVAPPLTEGAARTVVLDVVGSYEMRFGGRGFLNPWAVLAHRRGWDSLPRFAARRAQAAR